MGFDPDAQGAARPAWRFQALTLLGMIRLFPGFKEWSVAAMKALSQPEGARKVLAGAAIPSLIRQATRRKKNPPATAATVLGGI